MTSDRDAGVTTLRSVGASFEELIVRGLEASGPDDVRRLDAAREELARAGATYAAGAIGALVHAVREGGDAARLLLRAQTAMRVFERVLSLDAAAAAFGPPAPAAPAPAPVGDAPASLVPMLDELARAIERLVATGMTTASAATRTKLDATFREASRLRLGRLAASIKYVLDEIGRFLADATSFSPRRLAFFVNRTWVIARGLADAIGRGDRAAIARLLLQPAAPQRVATLRIAVVGVSRRALADGSASFEFRARTLAEVSGVPAGTRVVWSCAFGAKPGVPPEAFLHLPQPQKFAPKILLEPTEIVVDNAALTFDDAGTARLQLGPPSTVVAGPPVRDWHTVIAADRVSPERLARAAARIHGHRVSPLDLEVELHEELVVEDWELGELAANPHRPEQLVARLSAGALEFDAIVAAGPDGAELAGALRRHAQADARPPLFGVVHYDMGRLVFQPLSAVDDAGPQHLAIARGKIDLSQLMKTLDFTT